jgi:hypothetical protein
VADAECSAGDGVEDATVGAAVVGEHALDGDPMASVEGDRSSQKGGGGRGFLVGEDLRVGESAVVVDGDVHVLIADGAATQSIPCR